MYPKLMMPSSPARMSRRSSASPARWRLHLRSDSVTEACSLRLSGLTSDGLVDRKAKFGNSRHVPLSDSTHDELHRYLGRRKRLGAASDHLFVLSTGKSISPDTLTDMSIRLARAAGLRGGKGEAGITRLDLRHRSAVRSLEQAIDTDRDNISRHILALSTYTGHVSVDSTYWYRAPSFPLSCLSVTCSSSCL